MKKVLILTTSTGQGHNQAASSVEESFKACGYETMKYDFLAKNSTLLNDIIVLGYEFLAAKFPKLYGFFYKVSNKKFTNKLLRIPFYLNSKKVIKVLNDIQPDLIVASHAFSINVLENSKKNGLKTPYILIVTDFSAHYTYVSDYVDAYITGSEFTKQTLINKGISPEKIYPIGIPISQKFYNEITKVDELKDDYFNLLLMSGSLGLDSISIVLKELLKNKNKLRITVVCGRNTKLRDTLLNYCNNNNFENKKLHILGFTKDVSYLMDYSDIIISKPGGLTVTESIVKNIPLVIPFAIPGQEQENIDFLVNEGYSILLSNINDINKIVNNLIDNKSILLEIKSKLHSLSSTYSTDKIVEIGENLINEL